MKRISSIVLLLFLASFAGCGSEPDQEIREGIQRHLSRQTNLAMGNMRVDINRVDYEGDRATAAVTITARDDTKASMQMVYKLRREGSRWEVEPQSSSSVEGAHGTMTPSPRGGSRELPSGHPPVGGEGQSQPGGEANPPPQLPQGHPPVTQE